VSGEALAAVALGHLYFFTFASFGMGTLLALDPVVSQAIGARDNLAVTRAVQRGLLMAAALTIPGAVAMMLAQPILALLQQPAEIVPFAAAYDRASIPGLLPLFAFAVLRHTLQSMKRLAPVIWTIAIANLANVFFNWILIYGNLGARPLGPVGAAWASSISRALMALMIIIFAWSALHPHLRKLRPEVLLIKPMQRMLKVGLPIGTQFLLEGGIFSFVAILMGWLGPVQLASHHVSLNIAALSFMVPLGVSFAATVLVGHAVGRGDAADARAASGAALFLGTVFMSATAILMLTAPSLLASLYSAEPEVLALAATLIPLAGVFQIFDGLQVVSAGILRGVGDTRAPLVINLLGFWLIGLPTSLVLAFKLQFGPRGLWWGLVAGLAAVAIALLARVRYRMNQEMRRLLIDESH
jgi:MATE family multidrug resistance protein